MLGKGWISAEAQGPIVDGAVQIIGAIVAAGPAIYAALKIKNTPKTP
jgi:hypothetical protein